MSEIWEDPPFRTIPGLVDWAAGAYGDAPFLVGEDGAVTSFAQARLMAEGAARGFIAAGVEPGDRVALWAPNGAPWVIACLGLQLAGAVLTPINTRFRGGEAAFIIGRARASALVTVGDFLGADYLGMLARAAGEGAGAVVPGLPDLRTAVFLDGEGRDGALGWDAFLAAGSRVTPDALAERRAAIGSDSVADLLFTSGTTGMPKGAMHSHLQAILASLKLNAVNGVRPGDRMLVINPFFHSFGYRAGWMACLAGGMTAYPMAVFDIEAVMRAIESNRITVLPGPPTLFQSLLDHPRRRDFDLSSLRCGSTGSANLSPEFVRRASEELGFEVFLTSYGLTEATAIGTSCRIGDDVETLARTVGRPFPGGEMRIAAADGAEAPPGEVGEVLLRGDNVMLGYFEEPAATAAAIDADGWLHTGDLGEIGADGNLRIRDRLKDVVLVGGFNVYPAEVEQMLLQHPAIAEAAVIGLPDARLGEVTAAFVVLRPGAGLTMEELTPWARERMANFKVPRQVFVVEAFPRTPLGKVQKHLLREQAAKA